MTPLQPRLEEPEVRAPGAHTRTNFCRALSIWNDGTSFSERLPCFILKSTTVWKSARFSKPHCGPELGISPHNCSIAPTMDTTQPSFGRTAQGGCPHVGCTRACISLHAALFRAMLPSSCPDQ